jgi:hypothetical protein
MDADTQRVLSILDAFAKLPKEIGPVTLSQEYRDHIARVEALPQNQAGADKSWVHRAQANFRRHYQRALRR